MDYKAFETYKFSVEELSNDFEQFTVLCPLEKDVYEIVEESARLFYYGKSGWKQGWPLTFIIRTLNNLPVAKASVFILSSKPNFDVILL